MIYYVDNQGVCSQFKPGPRIKAGVVSSQIGEQEILGFYPLSSLFWFAECMADKLQTKLLGGG